MDQNDKYMDLKLGIDTEGIEINNIYCKKNGYYEPMPYAILDRLIRENVVTSNSKLIDFGSGKGRVAVYLAKKLGAYVWGIEYDAKLIETANKNADICGVTNSVQFLHMDVKDTELDQFPSMNQCYFYNPFSIEIFCKVISKITKYVDLHKRSVELILFYPTLQYVRVLLKNRKITYVREVDLSEFFGKNRARACIMCFEVKPD